MRIYQFRNCFLNTLERQVIKDGKHLELTSKTFDVLQFLVERSGEIVSKDEILGSVWNGSFVEEGNLPVHISKLRRLLAETPSMRYIETVQGTGYRFVSPVETVSDHEWFAHSRARSDPESYRAYLKGKYLYGKRTIPDVLKALKLLRLSASTNQLHVPSYVEIAECLIFLYATDMIRREVVRAEVGPVIDVLNQIRPSNDSVYAVMGEKLMMIDWNFDGAETLFRKACKINPSNLLARYRLAKLLTLTGRVPEALVHLNKIAEIDPFSLGLLKQFARLYYFMHRYEEAAAYSDEAFELESDDYETMLLWGAVRVERGDYDAAIEVFQRIVKRHQDMESVGMLGYAYASRGDTANASKFIRRLKSKSAADNAIKIGRILAALGDESALGWLQIALKNHEFDLLTLSVDPRLKFLWHDSRFRNIVTEVHGGGGRNEFVEPRI